MVGLAAPAHAAAHHRQGIRAPVTLVKAAAVHRPKAHVVDTVARRQTSAAHRPGLLRETSAAIHRPVGSA